jgi:hypothetical protein
MTCFSDRSPTCPLLPDILPKLHKLSCFLVEPGLHLADLLELCVLTPRRDWDHRGPQLALEGCQREAQA